LYKLKLNVHYLLIYFIIETFAYKKCEISTTTTTTTTAAAAAGGGGETQIIHYCYSDY
jgi:hypothetical protein